MELRRSRRLFSLDLGQQIVRSCITDRASDCVLRKPIRVATEASGIRVHHQSWTANTQPHQAGRKRMASICLKTTDRQTVFTCGSYQQWGCRNQWTKEGVIPYLQCGEDNLLRDFFFFFHQSIVSKYNHCNAYHIFLLYMLNIQSETHSVIGLAYILLFSFIVQMLIQSVYKASAIER
jgi:hypothetical protein